MIIAIASGKGGTGKTTVAVNLVLSVTDAQYLDCDVEEPNGHLFLHPELPYSFSYRFEDAAGRQSDLQILDWEAGALYRNCLRSVDGDVPKALAKVRRKYFDEFLQKDHHLFLGTTQQFHFVAPNPWVIVGVFPPRALALRPHADR